MDERTKSDEALRAFNIAKSDLRSHPATIQRLWTEYCEAVEKEMKCRHSTEQEKS